MNRIVIEFSEDDRVRLDALIAGLHQLVMYGPGPRNEAAPVDFPPDDENPFDEAPAQPAPVPDPAPVSPPMSLAEFQKAVTQFCVENPKKRAKVREVVNRFAPSVSEVPEGNRSEVLALLKEV